MKHFLNGVEISPRNIDDIGFVTNWSSNVSNVTLNDRDLELTTDTLILPNEGKKIINDWIANNGIFVGIPYFVTLQNNAVLKFYIDLSDNPVFKDNEVEVKIKRDRHFDNFFEQASANSFEYLAFIGVAFNYIEIPYIITPPNITEMAITLSLYSFVMGKSIVDAFLKTGELLAEGIAAIIPSVGLGVVVNVGAILLIALKLVLQIAYTILLIVMLKKLGDQIGALIFPKVRNFKACKVSELISKSCSHFGYNFKSSLLSKLDGLTVLPVPISKPKYKGKNLKKSALDYYANELNFAFTKGHPSAMDSISNCWDLIKSIETMFNAKCVVRDGTVYIERKDYWKNIATTKTVSSLALQDSRQDKYSFNVNDSWKRYYIHYNIDQMDFTTIDGFDYSDFEASTELLTNSDLKLIKGLEDRQIPYALATRKNELNKIENFVKVIFSLIDKLAKTSYASTVNNRIGVMVITSQYFTQTKMMYTVNGKQPQNYYDIIGAPKLWENYHSINQIQFNGNKIKDSVKVLMNDENFVNLLNNNYTEIDGVVCEVLRCEYKPNSSSALISFKQPYDYASKFVTTIVING